jgi:hypothetical protein
MNLEQVKDIAKSKGINPVKMKKAEIIKTIQRAEGNFDCFGTATDGYCDQQDCMWRTDCLSPKKTPQLSNKKIIGKIKTKPKSKR